MSEILPPDRAAKPDKFPCRLEALTADIEAHRSVLSEARNESRALRQQCDEVSSRVAPFLRILFNIVSLTASDAP